MSSRYHAERLTWQASKALLASLRQGSAEINALTSQLEQQDVLATRPQILRLMRSLKRRGLLNGSAQGGYKITDHGLQKLYELELKQIIEPPHWDKLWRLLLFDIPEEKRQLRNQVRELAKQLGCRQLQHSVWVHPFNCFVHFEQIRIAYGQTSDIIFMETQQLESAPILLSHFQKIYPNTRFK